MKFPISREDLQKYNAKEEKDNKIIQNGLIKLLDDLEAHLSNSRDMHFVVNNLGNERVSGIPARLVPRFIEKIKENIKECDITIDPVFTYVIIDWSVKTEIKSKPEKTIRLDANPKIVYSDMPYGHYISTWSSSESNESSE